ncbi:EamA family transporter RarD [Yinghuangia seranimata]|uniref:EamA family transporter RarD n=1 Tax=Yinghuangia seranimata TaxID=408067 RepID=UPI00248CAF2B|nr:EamA family transporter RarD [Yinghuangia seranimata]MDI2131469.1 EamA family transporter RarD [Yinghuangia seranimata]
MAHAGERRGTGLGYALGSQVVWGVQPLFWPLLSGLGTTLTIAYRIVWSCLAALAFVAVRPVARRELAALLHRPRDLVSLACTGLLLGTSWAAYVYAVVSGRVVEASLALLISPLAGALLGVTVLRERLRRAQWFACAVAAVALVVLVIGYGRVPWSACTIASTVSVYGLVRKRRPLPAAAGTAIELTAVLPIGAAVIVWSAAGGQAVDYHPALLLLLPAAGLITAVPSALRSAALSRLPLSVFGLLMYINPALQFAIGVGVRHEPMSALSWTGFALVWAALAVFAADAVSARAPARETRRTSRSTRTNSAPSSTR